MMDLSIIPECYVDTNLIETLVIPHKGYNHQKGCGTVTKVMQKYFSNGFAVGIIDKDKREVDYLKDFSEIINEDMLILHKHKIRHHYIIQISPAIEEFIICSAASVGISISEYGLPGNIEELQKEAKT